MRRKRRLIILFLALITALIHDGWGRIQQEYAELKTINVEKKEQLLTVTIEIEGKFEYRHFELQAPSRIVLEMSPVASIQTQKFYPVNAFGIKAVRTGRFQPHTARVVFDLLAKPFSYEIVEVAKGIQFNFQSPPEAITEKVEQEETEEPDIAAEKEVFEKPEMEEETHLKSINWEKIGGQVRVDVGIEGNFCYKIVDFVTVPSLALDFFPVHTYTVSPHFDPGIRGLEGIDVEEVETETVRITFDLTKDLQGFRIERTDFGATIVFSVREEVKPAVVKEKIEREEVKKEELPYPPLKNTRVGVVLGKYTVSDDQFDMIFGASGAIYGFELSRILWNHRNLNFALSFDVRRFARVGSSTVSNEETKFTLVPLTFSGMFLWNTRYIVPFIGAGFEICNYKEEARNIEISGSSTGPQFQLGLFFKIPSLESLSIKLYMKRTSVTAIEEDVEIDLGGFEFGVGISFSFDLLKKIMF